MATMLEALEALLKELRCELIIKTGSETATLDISVEPIARRLCQWVGIEDIEKGGVAQRYAELARELITMVDAEREAAALRLAGQNPGSDSGAAPKPLDMQ